MRIAFVGKGGSGKTTCAALFCHYAKKHKIPLLAIDADINIHLPNLLGFSDPIPKELYLSHPQSVEYIRSYLRNDNERIVSLSHFKKTTPPTAESGYCVLHRDNDPLLTRHSLSDGFLHLMVVGTYEKEEIGASCYHNNLSVLENILSHTIDYSGLVIADMVAGVDSFAGTLHTQFDVMVVVVEPTQRSIEVFEQFTALACAAGTNDTLYAIGNKAHDFSDESFLQQRIPPDKLIGIISDSQIIRASDRSESCLSSSSIDPEMQKVFLKIYTILAKNQMDPQDRLKRLWNIHTRYCAQDFIKDRFGDLSYQIDRSFNINEYIHRKYG